MKIALKKLGVILFLLFFVFSFAGCEDDEETAQGRVYNMTPYNFYNFEFAGQNFGSVPAYSMSEYKDLDLEGGYFSFQVPTTDGGYATITSGYMEAPEKGKKYTMEVTEYGGSFYYDVYEE
ncbi:MAG: hypothetical protein JXK07_15715 [Spirochaetes bacterium]|nr:hypothetical protein [Spirochaetota bacterium]MBN2771023.1 hypothetical protein [Spirochaetota bacterium]